jgi:Raf kinase inhibitor-like YbhB/YbcL family protein
MKKHTITFRILLIAMILSLGVYVTGCSRSTEVEAPTTTTTGLTFFSISSSAFDYGGAIPNQYANTGYGIPGALNTSIPLTWSNSPAGTDSFAITMVDTTNPSDLVLHWLVVNMPDTVSSLAQGASPSSMPAGSTEIVQYEGPYPPAGDGVHFYTLTVWALSDNLNPAAISDYATFIAAITPITEGAIGLIGTFDW